MYVVMKCGMISPQMHSLNMDGGNYVVGNEGLFFHLYCGHIDVDQQIKTAKANILHSLYDKSTFLLKFSKRSNLCHWAYAACTMHVFANNKHWNSSLLVLWQKHDWLAMVAAHSDSWLLAVAFYKAAPFSKKERYLRYGVHDHWKDEMDTMYNRIPCFSVYKEKNKSADCFGFLPSPLCMRLANS